MKNFFKKIGLAPAIVLILLGAGVGSAVNLAQASATTLRYVQTPSIHLYTGLATGATTARVTPYPKDLDGTKLTITDFGSNPTFTVDPKVTGVEEINGFTGIVDNGDNTATLTGLTRDLTSKYPYTTTGTGKIHGAGATVVFSNNPQMYGRLGALENDQTWTGTNTFSILPILTLSPVNGTDAANKAYVDAFASSGCANGNETTRGCVELATQIESASSTILGSTGAGLVLQARYATSSPGTASIWTVETQNNGKINQSFFDLTQLFTFNGGFISQASSTVSGSLNANSFTIAGKTVNNGFGGTGADGALAVSSGTTTINLGGAAVVVKNYTTISITGTGAVSFINANAAGTVIVLKSTGNTTLTSSAMQMIEASTTGTAGGAGANCAANQNNAGTTGTSAAGVYFTATNAGTGGRTTAGNSTGGALSTTLSYGALTSTSVLPYPNVFVSSGGGGGSCATNNGNAAVATGGIGGKGAGALILEVGGAFNFTTGGISLAGQNGFSGSVTLTNVNSGGGGGGGGGYFLALYNTLTANTGTVSVSGGIGGTSLGNGSTAGYASGGGGGASATAAGSDASANQNAVIPNGANGGAGFSLIGPNPR